MARSILMAISAATASVAILWALPKGTAGTGEDTALPHPLAAEPAKVALAEPYVEDTEVHIPKYKTASQTTAYRVEDFRVRPGSTVFNTLASVGIPPSEIVRIIEAAKPLKNLASIAAKTLISVAWMNPEDKDPARVEFALSKTRSLVVERSGEEWKAAVEEAEIEVKPATFAGVVSSSLWASASAAGMDPRIIDKMADVFAWQVDFNRQVRVGDRWRLAVEELWSKDGIIGYGEIIAAEYENAGVPITAVRFKHNGLKRQYFAPDGNSLRRLFLKSPLKFGRITSRFQSARFHPILKVAKPHLGVDYGAPEGTPIMAVGNGVVTVAERRGGSGNTVKIRHNALYATAYKHLSRFADGIKPGTTVEMGQVIGYVGQTGLATGPHLHFEFYEKGKVVDPLGMKFPSSDPVPERYMEEFKVAAAKALALLPPWEEATSPSPESPLVAKETSETETE